VMGVYGCLLIWFDDRGYPYGWGGCYILGDIGEPAWVGFLSALHPTLPLPTRIPDQLTLPSTHSIIAACVPCLRRVIESALHRLGLVSSHGPTIYHMDREESAVARNQNMRVTQEGRTPYENDTDREGAVGWEMTPQGSAVGKPSPPSWDVLDVK